MTETKEGLELAKAWAEAGYPVFRVRTDSKNPWGHAHGFYEATTDIQVIEQWWRQRPTARVGVSTGPADVVVVDLDVKGGVDGPGNWYRAFEGLTSPITYSTPSGGSHLYFSNEAGWTSHNGFLPGVDIKAHGGYVVAYGPPPTEELPNLPLMQEERSVSDSTHGSDVDTGELPLSWDDILLPHGYAKCGETSWVRPGKECRDGSSLSIIPERPWLLKGFSSSDPLGDQAYSKQRLYETLNPGKPLPVKKGRLELVPASSIEMEPTYWLWDQRIALGTLALLAGREGIGKSTLAYTLAADITNGTMMGEYLGEPRSVIIAATEDSWAHTINPRLKAAGADLSRVFQVKATEDYSSGLSLPHDIEELGTLARENQVALILLDPLISRLGKLDTHKDAEVRQALEPLVKMADESGAAVLGLLHVNKSGSTDPLTALMGSRAFSAVSRAVLFVVESSEDPTIKIMGQPKNNLGPASLPDLSYTLHQVTVDKYKDRDITSVALRWGQELKSGAIRDHIYAGTHQGKKTSPVDWLRDYLLQNGGRVDSAKVRLAGADEEGFSNDQLKRALKKVGRYEERSEFPRGTDWVIDGPEIIA
jgi:hypothetical protein